MIKSKILIIQYQLQQYNNNKKSGGKKNNNKKINKIRSVNLQVTKT